MVLFYDIGFPRLLLELFFFKLKAMRALESKPRFQMILWKPINTVKSDESLDLFKWMFICL